MLEFASVTMFPTSLKSNARDSQPPDPVMSTVAPHTPIRVQPEEESHHLIRERVSS
jgi:hypothetical protein